jgi:hypothetical protein
MQIAIREINARGALLVFPIKNAREPASLWSVLHPRKKMEWDWSEDSSDDVPDLWHLMKRLSDCRKVVYSKWYQGRATFFSREVFTALLALSLRSPKPLSSQAREIERTLSEDSPLSTKELKKRTGLQGRLNEATYGRACKELFQDFRIVAYGEVDDGAFPSLALGSTRSLFEELWESARAMPEAHARALLEIKLPAGSKLRKFYDRTQRLSPTNTA